MTGFATMSGIEVLPIWWIATTFGPSACNRLPDSLANRSFHDGSCAAWSHWYREAVLSVEEFEPGHENNEARRQLEARIDDALSELRQLERQALESLEP